MPFKLTLKNYRCFNWQHPASIDFSSDFVALIGPNNSGKSTILKSLFELRQLFSNPLFFAQNPIGPFNLGLLGISDAFEIVNDQDPQSAQIELQFHGNVPPQENVLALHSICISYDPIATGFSLEKLSYRDANGAVSTFGKPWNFQNMAGNPYVYYAKDENRAFIDFGPWAEACQQLMQSRYYGSFRNAINQGANTLFDMPVGTALIQQWDQWKAGNSKSQQMAIAQVEKDIARLLRLDSLQINADAEGKSLNVVIDH